MGCDFPGKRLVRRSDRGHDAQRRLRANRDGCKLRHAGPVNVEEPENTQSFAGALSACAGKNMTKAMVSPFSDEQIRNWLEEDRAATRELAEADFEADVQEAEQQLFASWTAALARFVFLARNNTAAATSMPLCPSSNMQFSSVEGSG